MQKQKEVKSILACYSRLKVLYLQSQNKFWPKAYATGVLLEQY